MCSSEENTQRRPRSTSPTCMRHILELRSVPPPHLDGRAGCETWSVDFSPDGSWFAWSMGHGTVRVIAWPFEPKGKDASERDREDRTLICGQTVWGLAFGPRPPRSTASEVEATTSCENQDSLLLGTGLEDGVIKIWSVATGLPMYDLRGHTGIARHLVFPPNGKLTLVSSSRDQTLRIWDLTQEGKKVHVLSGHKDWVACCSISPDCSMIASVGRFDRMVCLWSLRSYTFIKSLKTGGRHGGTFYLLASCCFSPDGAMLAIAAFTGDGWWIDLWDPYTTECLASMVEYSDIRAKNQISALQFSPSGLQLAIVTEDRALQIWEPGQNGMLRTKKDRASNGLCCAYHPQGGVVATGTRDGHVRFWTVPQVVSSLSHLCRTTIRHSVSTQQVQALPIPTRILKFLTYRSIPNACVAPEEEDLEW